MLFTVSFSSVLLYSFSLLRFNVPAVDIVRHLLPDVVVLIISSVSAGLALKVSFLHSVEPLASRGFDSPTEETSLTSPSRPVVSQQEYYQFPKCFQWSVEFLIFIMFLFSGSVVPSLTSFFYYFCFLFLVFVWSFHLRVKLMSFIRLIRIVAMLYSSCHLVVLYLYQFQSFQLALPVEPMSDNDSLIARYACMYEREE